ncbi:hypothetical protein COV11_00785 [Candidatus Woesearchaeota archaeon CG10_big_fil_rev_8_21_14_0_10_30_7]|nr:MAG: hypothetical protein COV11_00785 [Candidatus Woesearchaeota archaeon CG10_big_fil_rev_8_21_14_0_10_30_7]
MEQKTTLKEKINKALITIGLVGTLTGIGGTLYNVHPNIETRPPEISSTSWEYEGTKVYHDKVRGIALNDKQIPYIALGFGSLLLAFYNTLSLNFEDEEKKIMKAREELEIEKSDNY